MAQPRTVVHLDRDQLRVLAHPLRLRALGTLRINGPSTATAIAARLGSNSGKTSYHLRELAKVGLVVEEPELGNARERWWRAAHDVTSWSSTDFLDDPETAAVEDWLRGHVVRIHAERGDRWVATRADWSPERLDAAELSDFRVRLTPVRLREMNAEIHEVLRRYADTENSPDDEDAEPCSVILHSFPDPDPRL
jgi:DNA-binding transcriptional ArsR family regulator